MNPRKWKIYRRQKLLSPGYPIWEFEWYASFNKGERWFVADTFELLCKAIRGLYSEGILPS